jgi:hypothetical protein
LFEKSLSRLVKLAIVNESDQTVRKTVYIIYTSIMTSKLPKVKKEVIVIIHTPLPWSLIHIHIYKLKIGGLYTITHKEKDRGRVKKGRSKYMAINIIHTTTSAKGGFQPFVLIIVILPAPLV